MDDELLANAAQAAVNGFTDESTGRQYRLDAETGQWLSRPTGGDGTHNAGDDGRPRRLMGCPGPVSSVPTTNAESPYDDNESHWDDDTLPLPRPAV